MSNVKEFYDNDVSDNLEMHQYIFDKVFGTDEYIGQYSDNSASEIHEFGNMMNLAPASKLLDVGCGNGCIADFLSKKFEWNVTGIDISEKSIQKALNNTKEKFKNPNLQFIREDFYQYNPSTLFDGAYGIGSFCHFIPSDLFSRVSTLLKDGGTLGFMERIRLDIPLTEEELKKLTTDWHCPGIYSIAEYEELLTPYFAEITYVDLTQSAKVWHERSVTVREEMKSFIIEKTSEAYYQKSLDLAKYEAEPCLEDKIGYAAFIARK